MNIQQFWVKWSGVSLKERSAAQEHFIDLCRMLGQPTPAEADPAGTFYTFERATTKFGGGTGFADVWKCNHFAWEYKGNRADLDAAYAWDDPDPATTDEDTILSRLLVLNLERSGEDW